jgi:hypothetical protein
MARGGRPGKKRTQYVRDAQGQFASAPGGGKKATPSAVRKAARAAALKGGTLAARTSLKKSRSKLAGIDKADQTLQTSLSKRAQKGAVTRGSKNLTKAIKSSRTRLIGAKPNANTIKKKRPVSMAYVLKDVTRSMSSDDAQRILGKKPLAKRKISAPSKANTIKKKRSPILEAKPLQKPASQRPGSMTATLRGALKSLAQADAQRIREIESITGQKLKPIKERAVAAGAKERVRSTAKGGKISDTLRAGLRELAQSDARTMRGMAEIVRDATPKVSGGKSGKAKKALTPAKPTAPKRTRASRPAGTVAKPRGLKPGALAARRAAKAAKKQPQRTSKKPVNKAQRIYLNARSNARDRNRDLRGADVVSRRMANSAAAVLRNMERRRSTAVPKAPADSPRARQQQRQLARMQRAIRNERAAWIREADGPGSKASRSATVARRAQQIYAGKVDPKVKTKSRLTRVNDPDRRRSKTNRKKPG